MKRQMLLQNDLPQTPQHIKRTRRNFLIALAAGGTGLLVGGSALGKYLIDRLSALQVWDLDVSNLHFTQLTQLAWSPDGRYLATVGQTDVGAGYMIWNREKHTLNWQYTSAYQPVAREQFWTWSPDSQHFALAESTAVSLWQVDRNNLNILQYIHLDGAVSPPPYRDTLTGAVAFLPINNVLWLPTGTYLAYTTGLEIRVWDIHASKVAVAYHGHANEATSSGVDLTLHWSPDGQYIASTLSGQQAQRSSIRIWSVRDGTTKAVLPSRQDQTNWLSWSPNSRYLVNASIADGSSDPNALSSPLVNVYDIQSKKSWNITASLPSPGFEVSLLLPHTSWSPDSKYLATYFNGSYASSSLIRIYSVDQHFGSLPPTKDPGQSPSNWQISQAIVGISWSPDGSVLVAVCYDSATLSYTLRFYDPIKHVERQSVTFPTPVSSLTWSLDGKYLAVWGKTTAQVYQV